MTQACRNALMIASLGMLRSVADRVENGSEERRQEDGGTEAYLGLGLCTSGARAVSTG